MLKPTPEFGIPGRAKFVTVMLFVAVFAGVVGIVELIAPGIGWRYLKIWGIPIAAVYWPVAFRVLRRLYGENRMAAEKSRSASKQAKYWHWFFRYFMPFVALFFAIFGGIDAGPAWSAWHGKGNPGWAVVQQEECSKTCSWTGNFQSDDGRVIREGVWIWNPPADVHIGQRIRAVDTGDRTAVFDISGGGGRQQWLLTMLFFTVGTGYLMWWLGSITHLWRVLFRDGEYLVPRQTTSTPAK